MKSLLLSRKVTKEFGPPTADLARAPLPACRCPRPGPNNGIEAGKKEAALVLSLDRRATIRDPQREGISGLPYLPYAHPASPSPAAEYFRFLRARSRPPPIYGYDDVPVTEISPMKDTSRPPVCYTGAVSVGQGARWMGRSHDKVNVRA